MSRRETCFRPDASVGSVRQGYDSTNGVQPSELQAIEVTAPRMSPEEAAAFDAQQAANPNTGWSPLADDAGTRFSNGVVGAIKAVTVQPVLQVVDLATAATSVVYNSLVRPVNNALGGNAPFWDPQLHSDTALAYANGTSQTKLLLQSNFLTAPGVAGYDATTALMQGRYGDLAEMGGAAVTGLAIGKGVQEYGGYGITLGDVSGVGVPGLASQRGALRLELVTPDVANTTAAETALLRGHLNNAVARFEAEGYTAEQAASLIENPGLAGAHRGTQIDTFFKESVSLDPQLSHLELAPRFKFGPDVFNPANQTWWDVTTPTQWNAHVQKYWLFGDGTPLLTK